MYRGRNHGPWAFSCVPPARSLGEILPRFCGFSRCYGQENFPSVFLALTSPVAHAEGSGAMMRSSRPRHRASAIAECMSFRRQKAGADFSPASSDFSGLGAFFWPLGHFQLWHSRSSQSERTVSRAAVPDVVASRLLRPYHFLALIQSFQSVAAPFPGDYGFDRGCGLSGWSASGQAPRSRLAGEPIRRPSAGRKIRDGTMQDPFGIQKARYQGFRLIETYIAKICYISVLASKFPRAPTLRRTRSAGPA